MTSGGRGGGVVGGWCVNIIIVFPWYVFYLGLTLVHMGWVMIKTMIVIIIIH